MMPVDMIGSRSPGELSAGNFFAPCTLLGLVSDFSVVECGTGIFSEWSVRRMKQAIQIGAGNIGRGFMGALLEQAGWHVTFADVVEFAPQGIGDK